MCFSHFPVDFYFPLLIVLYSLSLSLFFSHPLLSPSCLPLSHTRTTFEPFLSPLPPPLPTHTSVELEPGDKATECHCLTVPRPSPSSSQSGEGQLFLGTYTMRWKRANSAHPHSLISTVSFPPIMAKLHPFSVVAGTHTLVYVHLHLHVHVCNILLFPWLQTSLLTGSCMR